MGITQKTEAIGMYSAEGEFVEFGHSVLLEGPVEVKFDSLIPEIRDRERLVFTSDGVVIRREERCHRVKIKPTGSEAEHLFHFWLCRL